MPTGVQVITGPASEPVTLTEAKARLKVTTDAEDDDITAMIAEARALAEAECGGRAFITQTLSLSLDTFPAAGEPIRLPRPPLASVTWVKYYDVDGVQQTLSADSYHVATAADPGRIVPTYAQGYWPVTQYKRPEAVEIRYVAGAASAPAEAKAAVLAIVADRHANPDGGDRGIPPAARRLLDSLDTREPS